MYRRCTNGGLRHSPMQITVPLSCSLTPSPCSTPSALTAFATMPESSLSKGSAILTCPTKPPSKKVRGRIYFPVSAAFLSIHPSIYQSPTSLPLGVQQSFPPLSRLQSTELCFAKLPSPSTKTRKQIWTTHTSSPINNLIHHQEIPWSDLLL